MTYEVGSPINNEQLIATHTLTLGLGKKLQGRVPSGPWLDRVGIPGLTEDGGQIRNLFRIPIQGRGRDGEGIPAPTPTPNSLIPTRSVYIYKVDWLSLSLTSLSHSQSLYVSRSRSLSNSHSLSPTKVKGGKWGIPAPSPPTNGRTGTKNPLSSHPPPHCQPYLTPNISKFVTLCAYRP